MTSLLERSVKSFLDIIILSVLAEGPRHGYGIIAKIHDEYRVLIGPGTLYPSLSKLEAEGKIKASIDEEDSRRKTYILTQRGADELVKMLRDFNSISKKILDYGFNGQPPSGEM